MSNSATPWTASLPCPSPSPGACSNSCPLSQWCYPTISSSVVPFSSRLQSFPALRSFPVSWLFASGGQSIGASASASVLPVNIQDWSPLGLTGLISLLSKVFSRVFSIPQFKSINSSVLSLGKSENWHWYNFIIDLDCIFPNIPTLDPSPTRGPTVHRVVPPSFSHLPQPQYFGCTKASSSTCPSVWFVWCLRVSGFRLCLQGWMTTDGLLCSSQSLWSGGTQCRFVLFPVMLI